MPGRPAALNRWNQNRGTWRPRHFDDVVMALADAKADANVERLKSQQTARVVHPVIELAADIRFRVLRLFRREGNLCYEPIGGFLTVEVATEFMRSERWRAQVFDHLDLVKADNFGDIEKR